MSRIYLIAPTYGRPENVRRMIDSVRATACDISRVSICLGYDTDDVLERMAPQLWNTGEPEIIVTELPTTGIGPHEKALPLIYPHEPDDVVMVGTDDQVFETTDWDLLVRAAIERERGPWLYYVNDGRRGAELATVSFMTKRTIDLIGGLTEPWLNIYGDSWRWNLFRLFDPPRVTYLPDVLVRHEWAGDNPRHFAQRSDVFEAIRKYGSEVATRQLWALLGGIQRAGEPAPTPRAMVEQDGLRFEMHANDRVRVTI
jgi:hypothetical protein